jgi:hypothetical protein
MKILGNIFGNLRIPVLGKKNENAGPVQMQNKN